MAEGVNDRVLVIDDTKSIHDDFRRILCETEGSASRHADALAAELFGKKAGAPPPVFRIDAALQGEEGLHLVEASLTANDPYAVAFVDMRMPPGWDGLETTERLWRADPELEIVICTAYAEYSWDEILARLGHTDQLLILKKPFDPVEVSQLATALTRKWMVRRRLQERLAALEGRVGGAVG